MACAASPTSAKRSLQYWRACVSRSGNCARGAATSTLPRTPSQRLFDLSRRLFRRTRCEVLRMRRARRPHDGAATVRERQESDRAVGEKPLPGGARMRMLGAHVRHECALIVVPAGRFDARELAAERSRAIGADDQGRAQRASVAERYDRAIALERHARELGAQQRDPLTKRRAVVERPLHSAVLDDVTEVRLARRARARNESTPAPRGFAVGIPYDHVLVR